MTEDELEDAISRGVIAAFRQMGLDCANPIEAQRDFAFLRDMRVGTQSLTRKTFWIVFSGAILALAGFAWAGFTMAIKGSGGG